MARRLGMTRARLLAEMSVAEFNEWLALAEVERAEAQAPTTGTIGG